jgi:hypothetical protein
MMNPSKSLAVLSAILVVGPLTGCAGHAWPSWNGGITVPSNGIVVGPNEEITLDAFAMKRYEYFCSDGHALQCDRYGLKLYCRCPLQQP